MDDQASPRQEGRTRVRSLRRVVRVVVLVLAVSLGWVFRGPLGFSNFGVVDQGRVYRSAQPGAELEETAREFEIRSVLNLRGGSEDDEFYRTEVGIAERLDLDLYDLPMSATRRPSRRELLRLLDVFDHCRYPVLIHCKSGADRTGLASALYRLQVQGEDPGGAEGSFSLAYGHVPLFGPETLHEPIVEYRQWLDREHLAHSAARFREWLTWEYEDEDPPGALTQPTRPGPRAELARRAKMKAGAAESRR
jgi:protein tyrosine phosphatase (PTP) superfamily phosphohydrolase (DUF442 family)